ncbi:SEC10/PgrA surface exclusion domain-containing protein [Levilactobacillus zymae]|nr:SEC10/PgrA surface exclusion domain-containing protein [Levilactobacillus zymae]
MTIEVRINFTIYQSNLILMATATLATLSGFSAIQAKADTASANSSDSATTKSAIAMSNTVAGAKQEVNDAQKTVTATQQAADTARTTAEASQELANNAQQQANLAQANLNQTTTAEKQAQQSADHATPTEIEHAQAAVTQQEKQNAMTSQQLSKDTEAVKAAQTNSATAQGQVNVANKNVETATQAVDQSQQQVDTAQQIVAGQGTAAAQADLERAKAEQAKAQATQDQAQNNLNTADQEALNRQKQVDSTSLGADQANQAVTVATQTANQATQAVSQAQAKLDAALANFKGSDSNTFPLSQDYITDLTAFAGIIDANKPEYAELQKRLATESEALLNQVKAYQPLATDQNVQLNSQADLTSEIRTELSLYAASLINQVRAAFGSEPLEVSNGSVDYSEKIAEAYMADGWNWDTKSHDLAAINRVDQQMNLGPNAGGESISGGTFTDDPNNWKLTLADFKKMIYQGIEVLLFNDSGSNYEHTSMTVKPWLNTTSENVSPEQLGVSFVVDHDQYPDGTSLYNFSVHYNYINGFIAGGENPTQEEFDHTPIVSTQVTASDVQTLRNDLATKQAAAQTMGTQLTTAQNRAQAATQSLKAAQLQLVTAKANQTAAQDSLNQAQPGWPRIRSLLPRLTLTC